MMANKKLERDPMNKVIGGVCSGLANFFDLDVALVRVAFVIALLFASFGFWLYIIMWVIIPNKGGAVSSASELHADNGEQIVTQNPTDNRNDSKTTSIIAGVSVIFIGIIFLVNNFIPISWVWKLWPLILVLIGVVIIVKACSKKESDERGKE